MKNYLLAALIFSFVLASCGSKKKPAGEASTEEEMDRKQFELVEAWQTDTSLRIPESVLYDRENDVLYVSNMNHNSGQKEGNGFISKLSTNGDVLELKWVEGMRSPKGLGLFDGKLYVSDVVEVIVIDVAEGLIIATIPIDGAKMLNDISVDGQGNFYVSDSETSIIHKISGGEASTWLDEGLNAPNGLLVDGDRLLLASIGSQDFAAIDMETKEISVLTENINIGDGVAPTGMPGYFLVSDWAGEVFLVYPDGYKASILVTGDEATCAADIEFIPELDLLLVPTFNANKVVAYTLKQAQ